MDAPSLLKAARRSTGLSQAAYAATVGVSQPVISAYECGQREPSLSTLERLVRGSGQRIRIDLVWDAGDLPRARDDAEHGARLVDVLSLADAIPTRRRAAASEMPRLVSTR